MSKINVELKRRLEQLDVGYNDILIDFISELNECNHNSEKKLVENKFFNRIRKKALEEVGE